MIKHTIILFSVYMYFLVLHHAHSVTFMNSSKCIFVKKTLCSAILDTAIFIFGRTCLALIAKSMTELIF